MPAIPKIKPVRLSGKEYQELRNAIIERERGLCCVCGRKGEVHHHEPPGRGRKSDTIYTGVYLCVYCHDARHNGKLSEFVKNKINDYLNGLYGEERQKYIIK